jgi:2,3-bisphosphoglycerate-independent phosphoglycerate mutase
VERLILQVVDDILTLVAENDTLFFFNYRSDRMREIVSVFGLDPKPTEVNVPTGLVRITYNL